MKEWEIIHGDWIKKFDDYKEDISKELDVIEGRLGFLRVSEEDITNIRDELLLGNRTS